MDREYQKLNKSYRTYGSYRSYKMAFSPITKNEMTVIPADKLPPQSLDAEESVLGALMMDKMQ